MAGFQTNIAKELFKESDSSPSADTPRAQSSKELAPNLELNSSQDELDLEKGKPNNDAASTLSPGESVGPEDEIVWRYLTFDTELPRPAHSLHSDVTTDNKQPPPDCPNLKPYVNPFFWPRGTKNFMTWFGCLSTTICAYTAGAYAAAEEQATQEFNVSKPAFAVGITLFTAGFATAPMFLAPFSEINGRKPVFVVSGLLFTLFQLTCALTPTFGGMLAARFLVGCAASTFATMVGGIVADFYEAKDRNTAMSIFAGGSIFGTGFGPLCSGFIAQHLNWRWVFRVQVISNGLLWVIVLLFFNESRGPILLSRKAKALNKWYDELESHGYYGILVPTETATEKDVTTTVQRIRWKVKADEERATLLKMLSISLYRPFKLLFTEPILFSFSLWFTFAWACLYLLFSAIPFIFQTQYGFDVAQTGAVFSVICIGSVLSTVISIYGEPLSRRYFPEKWQPFLRTPEGRLMFCCVQSALLPIGSFWYGCTSSSDIHWIVPTIGIGCVTMGIYSIYLAVFNYLADIYHIYASSAQAAQSFTRNMVAGSFPIFVDSMFRAMTFTGAGCFIGGMSLVLTVVPWMLVFYGPRIRARSKIARELLKETNPT